MLSLWWSNTGSLLIGFFMWTYICAFEYCGNICKRFLPLTLEIWYSALIWQERSTDILGIFCCVCLPDHLILCYIIYYIWNKLCKGCSSVETLVFILFRISVLGIEPVSSTCLGHFHLKEIVGIITFTTAGAFVLEKVSLNYEIQLAWHIFTWKRLFALWNSTSLGHFHLRKICLHYEFLQSGTLALEIQPSWSTCILKKNLPYEID